jgi:hypothetical protein
MAGLVNWNIARNFISGSGFAKNKPSASKIEPFLTKEMMHVDQPKLFISYSWSSPDHEQWVVNLATELRESGVDVILDKWDLREGQDAIQFMERMVSAPDIQKVAIIADETYMLKADGRAGGVGTETQIISGEIYAKQDQTKFVAVLASRDDQGKPYLPIYYKSRIFIDLSDPQRYPAEFERLIRWAYDKPLHVKPELGNMPAYLASDNAISIGGNAALTRAFDALRNSRPHAVGAVSEYLTTFSENLERFRLKTNDSGEFDELVVESIDAMLPARNEFIQLVVTICQYTGGHSIGAHLHRFFESLLRYVNVPPQAGSWRECDFDNFRFIVHELFLYAVGIALKNERFDIVKDLVSQPYYDKSVIQYGRDPLGSFVALQFELASLNRRNSRLNLGRVSLEADMLKQRSQVSGLDFRHLMQADFFLFVRQRLEADSYVYWWPVTLLYLGHGQTPFELFARCVSSEYLSRLLPIFGVAQVADLNSLVSSFDDPQYEAPRIGSRRINPGLLLGFGKWATRP